MHILMLTINDPAGTAIAFTRAINKYTEHSCRLITKELRYNFMFEKDLHLPWLDQNGWDEVSNLFKTSDVFHFHMTADEHTNFGPFYPSDYTKGKAIVHHHHGHPDFRANPQKFSQKHKENNRQNLLVSTPDLLKLLPQATWQPNLVPQNDPLYLPLSEKPNPPLRLTHSPTKTELKNTDLFLDCVRLLSGKTEIPLELDLIEYTKHSECLFRKQKAHILFDHLQGYFGVSSLEGLSQGLPVIAGLDDWNQEKIKAFADCSKLPWFISSTETLRKDLLTLIQDQDLRAAMGKYSRHFMENHWSEKKVIRQLADFYNKLN
jgi:glycosyltransferase involved in cell wall biosynthesis